MSPRALYRPEPSGTAQKHPQSNIFTSSVVSSRTTTNIAKFKQAAVPLPVVGSGLLGGGSGVARGWLGGGSGEARGGSGVARGWLGGGWGWGGSGVARGWLGRGSGVARGWLGVGSANGSGVGGGARVTRGWF